MFDEQGEEDGVGGLGGLPDPQSFPVESSSDFLVTLLSMPSCVPSPFFHFYTLAHLPPIRSALAQLLPQVPSHIRNLLLSLASWSSLRLGIAAPRQDPVGTYHHGLHLKFVQEAPFTPTHSANTEGKTQGEEPVGSSNCLIS